MAQRKKKVTGDQARRILKQQWKEERAGDCAKLVAEAARIPLGAKVSIPLLLEHRTTHVLKGLSKHWNVPLQSILRSAIAAYVERAKSGEFEASDDAKADAEAQIAVRKRGRPAQDATS